MYELAGAMTWTSAVLYETGRFDEAVTMGLEAEALAYERGLGPRWAAPALLWVAEALIDSGRWGEVDAVLERLARLQLHRTGQFVLETKFVRMDVLRGDLAGARRRLPRLNQLANPESSEQGPVILAELALWDHAPAMARAVLAPRLAELEEQQEIRVYRIGKVVSLGLRAEADILAGLDDRTGDEASWSRSNASALIARIRRVADETVAQRPFYTSLARAWLMICEGEFSRAIDQPDPDRWAAAAEAWAGRGMPYERAYALMREGEATLMERRNRSRAERALRMARDLANGLGAHPLIEAIDVLAARAKLDLRTQPVLPPEPVADSGARQSAVRPTRGRYELTPRELEVLALLAAGHSDGQIAESLFISKKTASVHLAAIKGKLGSRNRVEIVIDAIGLGLTPPPGTARQ